MKRADWKELKTKEVKDFNRCVELTHKGEVKGFLVINPPQELIRSLRMICQQVDACRQAGRFKNSSEPVSKLVFITEVPLGDIE